MAENKTEKTTSTQTEEVAQELLARDEQLVGVFFSALAIQYFLHKDMLNNKLIPPNFVAINGDIQTCATQRMFIKELIHNKKYLKLVEELQMIFLEYVRDPRKYPQPYLLFLSRINKGLLIRQIFSHGGVVDKYSFIEDFYGKKQIDLDKLNAKMWHFPIEQQILILAKIYSGIQDGFEDKKKTIATSYKENVTRFIAEVNKFPNKYQVTQVNNLRLFMQELDADTQEKKIK